MDMNNVTIVDVRTREEFMGGHVAGSVNIPLNEVVDRQEEIKAMKAPIIFCCLSGGRSGQATKYFQQLGVDCENGGGWLDLKAKLNQ